MNTQNAQRKLTWSRVARTLSGAIIPSKGANKLRKIGRGNLFTRENGTVVAIFNVAAFRTHDDAKAAAAAYKAGKKLELAGDIDGAQELYRESLNYLMSFSVLEENAASFAPAFEITCMVEEVENRDGELVLGINQPRPVEITAAGASVTALFDEEEPEEPEVETPPAPVAKKSRKKVTA